MKRIAIIENNILATNTIRQKLTLSLIQQGYKVKVFTTGTPAEIKLATDVGIDVLDVKASNQGPMEIIKYMTALYKGLKQFSPDVCLTFTIRPAIWGNLVTRVLNIPTITNITGTGPLFESDKLSYRAARNLYRFALLKTKKVFFQNEDDRDNFISRKYVDPSIVEVIPGSGVDPEKFSPMPGNRDGIFRFLFISRLIRDKGIGEYVDAARMVKKEYPGIRFQVLGPYWEQNLKSNIITPAMMKEWQEEGVVEYLGAAEDVRNYMANADCIVLPSYREGTSNVLLEAAAMERPAVTCDVTGCRSVVIDGQTGFLCRVKDADDLAAKMMMMYRLPVEEREAMGRRAREFVSAKFDKRIVINSYLEAIRDLAGES